MDSMDIITARRLDQYHKAAFETIAPAETSPAQTVHQAGGYLTYKGVLYKVAVDISVGGTLAPGTNIVRTTVDEMVGESGGGGGMFIDGQGYISVDYSSIPTSN